MAEARPGPPPLIAPALRTPISRELFDRRALFVCLLAVLVAVAATGAARLLTGLIALCTNLCWYGKVSFEASSPAGNHLGPLGLLVPVLGGLLVGAMARYGSPAIRGHGIPEAMEQVLLGQSRIPPRVTWLKPLSAALSIGSGGPFGAEGPIIATGGGLGSLCGQLLRTTASERKVLLAAGAASGMTATFGSPVAATLLALELLLFELRPRSLVAVALASVTATALRFSLVGAAPAFALAVPHQPGGAAICVYVTIGAAMGVCAVWITRLVYAVEEWFARLPVHWGYWPALGGVVVGLAGLLEPRTLGVGYENIDGVLLGSLSGRTLLVLVVLKFVSWLFSLGSGTSGGTLAPLFTIGGGLGALLGALAGALFPAAGISPELGALVGMAALFAGASRALLASVVFAFETTRQPLGLLPLLGACSAAYLVSCLLMEHSIMTEKIARRGVRVTAEQAVDFLELVTVGAVCTRKVVALSAADPLEQVRAWLASHQPGHGHQGFPVLGPQGDLRGVLTRRDLLAPDTSPQIAVGALVQRPPAVCFEDSSLREAADLMVREVVGRLPVLSRSEPQRVVGMLSRSDLLAAHGPRLHESEVAEVTLARLG